MSYERLDRQYVHGFVDHAEQYVNSRIHTNGLKNFWSLLKRGLKGSYLSVETFLLFRYLDEQAFGYNERKTDDAGRFVQTLAQTRGRRLTYRELTGKEPTANETLS